MLVFIIVFTVYLYLYLNLKDLKNTRNIYNANLLLSYISIHQCRVIKQRIFVSYCDFMLFIVKTF